MSSREVMMDDDVSGEPVVLTYSWIRAQLNGLLYFEGELVSDMHEWCRRFRLTEPDACIVDDESVIEEKASAACISYTEDSDDVDYEEEKFYTISAPVGRSVASTTSVGAGLVDTEPAHASLSTDDAIKWLEVWCSCGEGFGGIGERDVLFPPEITSDFRVLSGVSDCFEPECSYGVLDDPGVYQLKFHGVTSTLHFDSWGVGVLRMPENAVYRVNGHDVAVGSSAEWFLVTDGIEILLLDGDPDLPLLLHVRSQGQRENGSRVEYSEAGILSVQRVRVFEYRDFGDSVLCCEMVAGTEIVRGVVSLFELVKDATVLVADASEFQELIGLFPKGCEVYAIADVTGRVFRKVVYLQSSIELPSSYLDVVVSRHEVELAVVRLSSFKDVVCDWAEKQALRIPEASRDGFPVGGIVSSVLKWKEKPVYPYVLRDACCELSPGGVSSVLHLLYVWSHDDGICQKIPLGIELFLGSFTKVDVISLGGVTSVTVSDFFQRCAIAEVGVGVVVGEIEVVGYDAYGRYEVGRVSSELITV